jgi:spore coat polysaccharide biosynthesis protein SpsF
VFQESDGIDYASNNLERTYPLGLDAEVFTRDALVRAHLEARLPYEREHVTPYIYNHPELFSLRNVVHSSDLSAYRLTVDEPAVSRSYKKSTNTSKNGVFHLSMSLNS